MTTAAMWGAFVWLKNRNGDGVFDKNHVLVAGGEKAPVMRSTWNKLAADGLLEFYEGKKRIRLTDAAKAINTSNMKESEPDEDAGYLR